MAYTRAATSDKTRAFGTIEKMVAASGTAITADETDRHSLQAESEIPQKCRLGDELGHGRDTTEAEK